MIARRIILGALVLAAVAVSGCAGGPLGHRLPQRAPEIRGRITSAAFPMYARRPGTTVAGTILVEGSGSVGDKASLSLTDLTPVWRKSADGTAKDAAFADLKVGAKVEVWIDGPVAESYPVQGTASLVVIVP